MQDVFEHPQRVLLGGVLQYSVMPLLGLVASRAFGLPPLIAAGVGLVACCPGGTASNVVTYLAGADVALSVSMTTASTLGAVVFTPLLTQVVAGTLVPIDALALFKVMSQATSGHAVIILPLLVYPSSPSTFPPSPPAAAPASPDP